MSVEIDGEPRLSLAAERSYNMTCRVRASRPAALVSWQRNAQTLNSNTTNDLVFYETHQSATDSRLQDAVVRLTVVPSHDDHDQVYYCLATHPALIGAISTRVTIHVTCALYSSPFNYT